ncbi:DUF1186 domain-containing protein [Endozoicomonas sp. SCSIO W0465]|uniref:DUF1186 domain-containing protein n=1 Tax=Endozoicomonas sp. SCSIO W0465 TaxID=2918516 RepID=UPI002075DAE4|nr:DUF1186 domain-containing protein [Endozoicomonas sp. SCSIO W0465]USE37091.1 DUF1186 domain-containing protein [Endozoicomonas sp. SCSIO W0465]
MTLSTEDISGLKKSLSRVSSELPLPALREASEHQEAITPMLLQALEAVKIRDKHSSSSAKSRLALHALYLLTQFREPAAWPIVIDLFSAMSSADNIAIGDDFDEVVCDRLSQIFATLCPGDIRPLQSIVENTSIDEYVRDAALGALVVRYQQGDLELQALIAYLHQLYEYGLEQEKNQVWNAWVQACYNTQPEPFMVALKDLYEKEWADSYYITLDELKLRCGVAPDAVKKSVMKQEGEFYCYLDDAVAALRQLSCYSSQSNELLTNLENMVINQTTAKQAEHARPTAPFTSLPAGVGRNDPCPCGSGKKFKKCCLH